MFGLIVQHETTCVWVWVLSPDLPVYMFERVSLYISDILAPPLGCISRDCSRSGAQDINPLYILLDIQHAKLTVVVVVVKLEAH